MSCCGKKRTNIGVSNPATYIQGTQSTRFFGAAADGAQRGPEFEYTGGAVLTVVGPGSGLQYRFVGHGARVSVDFRDRASFARVPVLREVNSR